MDAGFETRQKVRPAERTRKMRPDSLTARAWQLGYENGLRARAKKSRSVPSYLDGYRRGTRARITRELVHTYKGEAGEFLSRTTEKSFNCRRRWAEPAHSMRLLRAGRKTYNRPPAFGGHGLAGA